MKQKIFLSMIGVLIMMINAVSLFVVCKGLATLEILAINR